LVKAATGKVASARAAGAVLHHLAVNPDQSTRRLTAFSQFAGISIACLIQKTFDLECESEASSRNCAMQHFIAAVQKLHEGIRFVHLC
jgi:hypothetical protein